MKLLARTVLSMSFILTPVAANAGSLHDAAIPLPVSTDDGGGKILEESIARMLRGKADLSWLLMSGQPVKLEPSPEESAEAQSIIALARVARSRGLDRRSDTLDAMKALQTTLLAEAARRDLLDSIKLTDDDVNHAMQAAPGRYDEYQLSHVFVAVGRTPDGGERSETAARDLATGLRDEIAKGGDFAAVAKRSSEDPSTAEEGGALSSMFGRYMADEFFPHVRLLAKGAVSEPIRGAKGYHLVRLDDRIPATIVTARFMATDDVRTRTMPGLIADAIREARP